MQVVFAGSSFRHALARWSVTLATLLVLVGGSYVAGVHQHHNGESDGHCAVCSFAGATAAATADVPLPLPPEPERATLHVAPAQVPACRIAARPSTRAPPAA